MGAINIILGLLLITTTYFIIRSNRSLKKLLKSNESRKLLDDKSILDHIIYTRSSFNGIHTTIALISFILIYTGFNVYDRLDTALQNNLKIKADTISNHIIQSTKNKVDSILTINLDALIQKRNIILEYAADVQRQKKNFDSLNTKLAKLSKQIETTERQSREITNGPVMVHIMHEAGMIHEEIIRLNNDIDKSEKRISDLKKMFQKK